MLSEEDTIGSLNTLSYYQVFIDILPNLEIRTKATTKPNNWDSTWYYKILNVIWSSSFNGGISSDGLYMYNIINNKAKITRYLGTWGSNSNLLISK